MYNSPEELEAVRVGSVLGIFRKDNSLEPYQVAVKNAFGQWAFAGRKQWMTTEALFSSIQIDELIIQPMWLT